MRLEAGYLAAWLLGLAVCLASPTVQAQTPEPDVHDEVAHDNSETFAQFEANVALFHDIPGRNMIPDEFGYGARLGHRWQHWGAFFQIAHNLWAPNRQGWTIKPGVLNVGVGAEYLFFDRRVRVSAAAGSSTLLFETVLDEAGTTGFFVDARPAGLRWELTEAFRIEWDPVIFSLTQPVVGEPTLDKTEFKSVLMFEVGL